MVCPNCHSRCLGRVGVDQYYCWDCCVEWVEAEDGPHLFAVDEEGELQTLAAEEAARVADSPSSQSA